MIPSFHPSHYGLSTPATMTGYCRLCGINSVDNKNPQPLPDAQKLGHCLDMSPQAKHPNRAGVLARAILSTLLFTIVGCASPGATSYQHITNGMSEAQVQEVLGPPSSKLKQSPAGADQTWTERWHWSDNLGTLASSVAIPDQPPAPQLGTVWFDSSGLVVRFQTPRPRSAEPLDTPWLPPAIPAR
jgi:hypothetical protein